MTTADRIARVIANRLDSLARHYIDAETALMKASAEDWALRYRAVEELAAEIAGVWTQHDFAECVEVLELHKTPLQRARPQRAS